MPVTAYASSDVDPLNNPSVTAVVDLSVVALPQNVTLYADLVDSGDPAPTKSFQWYVIGSDPGAVPVLIGDDTDTVTVPITTWYSCQMFVVGTNDNTAESSVSTFDAAPDSAKVDIRVLEDDSGLERFARGQKFSENINNWALQIRDNYDDLNSLTLSDLTDVTLPVADLNKLGDGSSMAGKHTHRGLDVPFATAAERGTVQFEEASASGKVAGRERHHLSGFYTGTLPAAGGSPVMTWRAPWDMRITGASVTAIDGGTGPHTFDVSWSNVSPHVPTIGVGISINLNPPSPGDPASASAVGVDSLVSEGEWVNFHYSVAGAVDPSDVMFQIEFRRDPV